MPEPAYIAESLRIEDDTVHIEQHEAPANATFEEAKALLEEQRAEMRASPPGNGTTNGMLKVVGYDGYYYLKYDADTHELIQLGAKHGNGERKGDHTLAGTKHV